MTTTQHYGLLAKLTFPEVVCIEQIAETAGEYPQDKDLVIASSPMELEEATSVFGHPGYFLDQSLSVTLGSDRYVIEGPTVDWLCVPADSGQSTGISDSGTQDKESTDKP